MVEMPQTPNTQIHGKTNHLRLRVPSEIVGRFKYNNKHPAEITKSLRTSEPRITNQHSLFQYLLSQGGILEQKLFMSKKNLKLPLWSYICVIIISFFIISSCFFSSSSIADDIKNNIPKKELTQHFKDFNWGTFKNISEQVAPYFIGKSVKEAKQILIKEKFSIREGANSQTISQHKKYYKKKGIEIDQMFSGYKKSKSFRDFSTAYNVSLFSFNNQTVAVNAIHNGWFPEF